jgi:hypothetical protein
VNGFLSSGSRPSPALIVAMIALVAAFAGTAVAADLPGKKVTKSKVKQIAAKQVNKLAPGLSVASAELAETAETAGRAENVLWAVVDNGGGPEDAVVARAGQPGTTVLEDYPYGVNVDFGRQVTGCVWIATKGAIANATPPPGEVTTQTVTANPDAVHVRVRDGTVGGHLQQPFHLLVTC